MKAIVIDDFGGIEKMRVETGIKKPVPKEGEVLIESAFAAVNPVDWKIREGKIRKLVEHRFPIILGWDVAGVVAGLANGVGDFKEGDEVYAYCRKPVVQWGTFAEYVTFPAVDVAPKPKSLSLKEAASIPLTALTAWQALFEFANLKPGQTVLVHAGAGGVGGMAIQFAKVHGALKIYTTASKKNHDYVMGLGADVAIDYKAEDFVERIRELEPKGVDVALDCVGGETLEKSFSVVKKGGVLATICEFLDESAGKSQGIKTGFVFVRPDGGQLRVIGGLIDKGDVKPPAITEYVLEDASKALEESRKGHTRGKLVLKIK